MLSESVASMNSRIYWGDIWHMIYEELQWISEAYCLPVAVTSLQHSYLWCDCNQRLSPWRYVLHNPPTTYPWQLIRCSPHYVAFIFSRSPKCRWLFHLWKLSGSLLIWTVVVLQREADWLFFFTPSIYGLLAALLFSASFKDERGISIVYCQELETPYCTRQFITSVVK